MALLVAASPAVALLVMALSPMPITCPSLMGLTAAGL
jgi:hypothetical protein